MADLERQLGVLKEGGSANIQIRTLSDATKLDAAKLGAQIHRDVQVYTIRTPETGSKPETTVTTEVVHEPTGRIIARYNSPNNGENPNDAGGDKPEGAGKPGVNVDRADAFKRATTSQNRALETWFVEPRRQNNPDLEKRIDVMEKKLDMLIDELKRSRTPASDQPRSR